MSDLNQGFAFYLLQRAIAAEAAGAGSTPRARNWMNVIEGWLGGMFSAGSRTPLNDIPA